MTSSPDDTGQDDTGQDDTAQDDTVPGTVGEPFVPSAKIAVPQRPPFGEQVSHAPIPPFVSVTVRCAEAPVPTNGKGG